jgi:putative ABC transport system ATP-binding protein
MKGLTCRQLAYRPTEAPGRPAVTVLEGVDAVFPPATLSLISGPTGAGKTTLLHLLAGLLRPTAGEVCWGGEQVSRWHSSHKDRWRRGVGIVFQHQHLLGELTAGENVLLPLIPRKQAFRAQAAAVETALARVNLLDRAGSRAARLSGGERQRLSLARAIAPRPALLLVDEPSAFQDDAQTENLIDLLLAEKQRGAVVVVSSHDPRLRGAGGIDHPYRLDRGRLEAPP